jgi:putative transposase
LRAEGRAVGKKRIARLMRAAGIVGVSRRRGVITTRRDRDARPAPDLVDRNFTADRPNQLWVADITYVSTAAGFLYLPQRIVEKIPVRPISAERGGRRASAARVTSC